MYIDLNWTNTNSGSVKTNIYRSLTALDKANLGTPIATLTNGETKYRDNNVVANTTYNYVIEFEANGVKVSTRNFVMKAEYVRGHGSPAVMLGTDDYGLMTYVTVGRLIGVLRSAGIQTTGTSDVNFNGVKFSYKGKVYYSVVLPANQVNSTLTPITPLYNNNAGIPIVVDGFNYLLRLGKVLGPSWDGVTKVASIPDFDEYYTRFILPQLPTVAFRPEETLGKLNNLTATNTIIGREMIANTIATRLSDGTAITWVAPTTSTAATQYIPFILELVE